MGNAQRFHFLYATGRRRLRWCAIAQGRVRSMVVVVLQPALELPPGIGQRKKDLHVQALVPQLAVKAFDIAVLDRPSRPDEVQVYAVRVGS